jgi:hypothetical protein
VELLDVKYALISSVIITKIADREIRDKYPSLKD